MHPTGDVGDKSVDYSGSRTDLHVYAKFVAKEAPAAEKSPGAPPSDSEDFS